MLLGKRKLRMDLLGLRVKQPSFKLKIKNTEDKCDNIQMLQED